MKKEWFEPGPDGVSPFVRKYKVSPGGVEDAIAAAFRALLAGDEQPQVFVDLSTTPDTTRAVMADANGNVLQEVEVTHDGTSVLGVTTEPPALQVGDVVRLERYKSSRNGVLWINEVDKPRIGKECVITGFTKSGNVLVDDTVWPRTACTLIRRAGEAQSVDTQRSIAAALANGQLSLQDEITRMRAELERLQGELDDLSTNSNPRRNEKVRNQRNEIAALNKAYVRVTAERDALQASLRDEQAKRASIEAELAACRESRDALRARIDAGVRVWGSRSVFGGESYRDSSDTHTALLIDVRPIDQPDHIPDAGKMVDERKGEEVVNSTGIQYRGHWLPFHDRRRTAGTIADRGKA